MTPETKAISFKKWRERNLEKERARSRAWRESNVLRNKELQSKWRLKNLDYNRERIKKWRQENPYSASRNSKLWRAKNKERVIIYRKLDGSRRRKSETSFTLEDITEIFILQKKKCAYCKCRLTMDWFHLDHIRPLSRGGTNKRNNIQITCPPCNKSKHAKDPIDFAQSKGLLL